MRKILAIAAGSAALALATAASAAVTIGSYTLDTGTFGAGTGVHGAGGNQSGTTVTGIVNQDGSGVTFTSSDTLGLNGGGQATITGPFSDLGVTFDTAWNKITFDLDRQTGRGGPVDFDFSLSVNGVALFDGISAGGNCSICTVGNGSGQFVVSGPGITTLAFDFKPDAGDITQFRVQGVSAAVPEPATWAMMLGGFFGLGAMLRARRRTLVRAAL